MKRPSAESGSPLAQYWLGRLLYVGQHLPRDFERAADWLGRASAQGHPQANDLLARCYFFGRGVAQDRAEAARRSLDT